MTRNSLRAARFLISLLVAVAGMAYCLSVTTSSSIYTTGIRAPKAEPAHAPGPATPGAEAKELNDFQAFRRFSSLFPMVVAGPSITATKSHAGGPFHLGDTITYSTTITNNGPGDATGVEFMDTPDPNTTLVGGSIMASPVTVDDSYACTGNLSISIGAPGVLGNDFLGINPAVTSISAFDATSAHGGTVSMTTSGGSAGAFTYEPAAGFRGTDTFTYTLTNTVGSSVGAVTITVSNMVWFINNASTCASNCDGRFSHPFTTLAAFQAVNDGVANHPMAGDAIFIYQGSGNYTGPLTLLANQRLTGQGDALNSTTLGFTPAANGPALPGATAKPTLTGTLTLATGVTALAIDLSTGSSTGMTGSGGLSGVTVGDASPTATNGFTVTTTTGTAVNLNNVGGTFTFRSISANGGSNGIVLSNTTGSFSVVGDGSNTSNNSGGTLQNMTGADDSGATPAGTSIVLNNAQSVSFTSIHIHANTNYGIRGTSSTGFSLDHSVIDGQNGNNSGAPFDESSIRFDNATGTVGITNSNISGGFSNNIQIVNTSGTITLTINNCNIHDTGASPFTGGAAGNDGVLLETLTTAVLSAHITNSTFSQDNGDHLNATAGGSGNSTYVVTGNNFSNTSNTGGRGTLLGGNFFLGTANFTGTFNYNISNNGSVATPLTGDNGGAAIFVDMGTNPISGGSATVSGTISNNVIGDPATNGSGSASGSGIDVEAHGTGTHTVAITNNKVRQWDNEGIILIAGEGGAKLNATVTGNTVSNADNTGNPQHGMLFTMGTATGDNVNVCLDIKNNTSAGVPANSGSDIRVRARFGAQVHLPGYAGASTDTAAVVTFLSGQNTATNGIVTATIDSGTGSAYLGGAACASAANPMSAHPVLTASSARPISSDSGTEDVLRAVKGANPDEEEARKQGHLSQSELNWMAQAAMARWQAAGISIAEESRLQAVTLEVTDLAGDQLALTTENKIQVDVNAAGYGWFFDQTPADDSKFNLAIFDREFEADDANHPAFGHMDLLTALMHAYGFILGKDEAHAIDNAQAWLVKSWLATGVRRVPNAGAANRTAAQFESADASKPPVPRSRSNRGRLTPQAAPVDVVVGTLNPGKSVIIKFQVTVNNPLTSPSTANSVSNTGSVSGSNFTTVNSNTDTAALCVPTTITTPLTNQQVAAGTTATFTTTLTGSTPFTFAWKKGATPLASGDLMGRLTITPPNTVGSSTTSTLTITGTVPADSGTYTVDGTDLAACADPPTHQTATLTVVSPPTIVKSFSPSTIPLNGVSTLTLTLTNPNSSVTLTGVNFSDNFPAGLKVANPAGIGSTCTGTWNATPGDTTLNFGGGTMTPGQMCTLTVNVTGTAAGVISNATNAPQSNEGGTGVASNTAMLTVVGPPTIAKSFASSTVPLNGLVNLNFTITNPNTTAAGDLTGISFTDTLPAGLTVADSGPTATCGGGMLTTVNSTGKIMLTGASIAHNAGGTANCTFSVPVTGATAGLQMNTTGAITSNEGGTGATSNTATITVVAPPSIAKSFNPTNIAVGATSTLTFTITNPNTTAAGDLTGVMFTDILPAGVTVATSGPTATCGAGSLSTTSPSTISLTGATVAHNGNCTFNVTVTGATAGVKNNLTGNVNSTNGGQGNTAMATLIVASPPTIMKSFGAASIQVGQTTSLTFSLTNPNTTLSLTGISFTDTLPAGLSVATGTVATCGGTLTTTAPNLISFSGGTLGTGLSNNCSFGVTVMGVSSGVQSNTTGVISSNESGPGATSNTAMITVVGAPTISKSFSPTTICTGGVSTLTFTLTNPNTTTDFTGVAFTDNLPSGLQVAATPNPNNGCTAGTFNPNAGDTTLTFSGGAIAKNSSCTVKVDVTATTAGTKNNTSGAISSTEGGTGGTASASLTVDAPPVAVADTFATLPNTTLNQPAPGVLANDTLNGASIFSYGATTGGEQTTIGAATPTSAGGSVSLNADGSFSYTPAAGFHGPDTFKYVLKSPGGCTSMATVTINVATPPTIMKSFGQSSILLGQTTSLMFSITNPNSAQGLTGISFTDTLPAGITVATSGPTAACGGMVSTTAPNLISFSGGTLAASGNCSFNVTVTGSMTGVWSNTTGAISSNESGTGATSNTAMLTVVGPPSITKGFDAATIPLNGTSVLSFTITNPNTTTAFTGVAVTDTLPAGLTVPNGSSIVCGGGTLTTTAPNMISLSGGAIGTSSNCSFSVTVTGTTAGVKNNLTGSVSAANGGTGGTANASITVVAPPTIHKDFGAGNIPLNGTTTLSFTITNPNSVGLNGVAFTDTLPAGLTTPNNAGSSQCSGTLTVTGNNLITLAGASIAASGSCTFSVTVTGTTGGVKNNTTGAVSSTNGGTGTTSNTAMITVATPPTISKAFGAATVPVGGTTTLTFTITNTNSTLGITGVNFTDTLPAGLTVANGSAPACGGGTVTTSGGNLISFSGGSIAGGGNCSFSVTVTGATAGVKNNTTGNVSANETGTGTTSNMATLTVLAPPTISKVFGAGTIPLGGTTTLTFTINNPNGTVGLTGVGFTDTLPAGLTVANGTSSQCGGTLTITGNNLITLSGATIAQGGMCTFSVNVTGTTAGVKNNTTGAVTSANGGMGTTSNTAMITVVAPPTITKAFGASFVPVGQTTTLTFTLTNPNATVALTGVGFTDAFPAGLVVANPSNAMNACGGVFTANPGATSLTFTGGMIAAGGSCVISVSVQVTAPGTKTNTTSAITSTEGGTGNPSNTVSVVTFDKCLRDDATGNFVQFSSMTGDYRFVQCSGGTATLTGTGTLTINGNVLTITDRKPDRRVSISDFTNTNTGHASISIQVAPGVWQSFTINDTNPNAVCACGP